MDSNDLGESAPKSKPKIYNWTTAKASVRTEPDADAKLLDLINAKTRVEYLKKKGSWRQVKTDAGTGWVLAAQLSDTDPAAKSYRWTTGSVNLRKGPSVAKASLGTLPSWEKVIHHRISGAWSEVTTSKGHGWVANTGLSKSGPLPVAVYGTLRPGQGPYRAMLHGKTTGEERTRIVDHNLYIDNKNGLSYILPEASQATGVVSYRMTLKRGSYNSTVARLDAYERYDPSKLPDNQLYVRKRVTDTEGNTVWAYVGGAKMSKYLRTSGIKVPTGDYLKRF
ncbi:SH3 domain-containing protein [Paeniglutamicibacter cryotolerans]|nr:SH3 domain-containing protein [Paeniglutamicibacter cryotolerans]